MFLLHALRRPPVWNAWYPVQRCYASTVKSDKSAPAMDVAAEKKEDDGTEVTSRSSCPPGTVLGGIAYLKNQPPVVALPEDEYPPWLWTLLEPKQLPDDGPGGKAEKYGLRKANRQRIRDQNFMKTQ